jgi:hypothetical protein
VISGFGINQAFDHAERVRRIADVQLAADAEQVEAEEPAPHVRTKGFRVFDQFLGPDRPVSPGNPSVTVPWPMSPKLRTDCPSAHCVHVLIRSSQRGAPLEYDVSWSCQRGLLPHKKGDRRQLRQGNTWIARQFHVEETVMPTPTAHSL